MGIPGGETLSKDRGRDFTGRNGSMNRREAGEAGGGVKRVAGGMGGWRGSGCVEQRKQ